MSIPLACTLSFEIKQHFQTQSSVPSCTQSRCFLVLLISSLHSCAARACLYLHTYLFPHGKNNFGVLFVYFKGRLKGSKNNEINKNEINVETNLKRLCQNTHKDVHMFQLRILFSPDSDILNNTDFGNLHATKLLNARKSN